MSFKIASSPHNHNQKSTSQLMLLVAAACIPGILIQAVFFGYGVLVQLVLAVITAWFTEALILILREKRILPRLKDNSALVTAVLLAVSIPPYAPWWIIVLGTAFAIIIVKQLYGGLGNNPFNPAMAAYIMLLVSFPVQMTQWLPALPQQAAELTPADAACAVFTGYSCSGYSMTQLQSTPDGITMATPLDTLRMDLSAGLTASESLQKPIFNNISGHGWFWVNLAYLLGGLLLLQQKVISWRIPLAITGTLFILSLLSWLSSPDTNGSPLFHLFAGATMLGAFFIATDPVSASTTDKGRIYYGILIGILVYSIRKYGGYPDAFAFAVVLANMTVPLIDYYTKPRAYGHTSRRRKQ
ncbi:electron transport complex subunit RsxD [Chromatiaceae bacterium AAb-1]|nr:electron transport complex subunit RsxD [Chromatiaceae bacterium AAb-1]